MKYTQFSEAIALGFLRVDEQFVSNECHEFQVNNRLDHEMSS